MNIHQERILRLADDIAFFRAHLPELGSFNPYLELKELKRLKTLAEEAEQIINRAKERIG